MDLTVFLGAVWYLNLLAGTEKLPEIGNFLSSKI